MPSPEQIVAVIAAILIPILAALFKQSGIGDPQKSWVEFILSLVVAYAALVVTGKLPWYPNPGTDPLQWATAIGSYLSVIFTLAYLVYNLFRQQIQSLGGKLAKSLGTAK